MKCQRTEMTDMEHRHYHESSAGERIQFLRKKQGISREELAQQIGVPEILMIRYEHDKLKIPQKLAEKIASVLHTNVGYILCWEPAAEIYMQMQQAQSEEALLEEFGSSDSEAVEIFFDMNLKSPDEKDEIISTGAFNDYIEGYLVYTLQAMRSSENEIKTALQILQRKVFVEITPETARKAAEAANSIKNR